MAHGVYITATTKSIQRDTTKYVAFALCCDSHSKDVRVVYDSKIFGQSARTKIHRTGNSLCKRVVQKMADHGAWPPSDKGVEPRVYNAKPLSPQFSLFN